MKIKEVCERTGLTERTVRFYQQKGLLTPSTYEQNLKTYYDYSESDIQRLEEAAMLRRCGFSIEELLLIRDCDVEALPEICRKHLSALREENSRQQFQLQVMEQLEHKTFSSKQDFMDSVASAFRSQQITPPPIPAGDVMPDFSKFDTETPEEKQEGYLDYLITQRKQEKRQEKLRSLYFPTKRFNILRYPKWIFAAAAAMVAIFILSCIPRPVSREMEGILFTPNTDHCETIGISIEGKVTDRLFEDPMFEGFIRIDGVPYSQKDCIPIIFPDNFDFAGWLVYNEIKGGTPYMYSFGKMYTDKYFGKVFLDMRFYQESYNLLGDPSCDWGPVLCAPASSYEEALKIVESVDLSIPLEETPQYFHIPGK